MIARISGIAALSAGIGAGAILTAAQPQEKLAPSQVAERVGQVVTVCGPVAEVYCESQGQPTLVQLGARGGLPIFNAVIAAADRARFGPGLEGRYQSRQMCVTGKVESVAGGYAIAVTGPDRVAIEGDPLNATADVYGACDKGVQLPKVIRDVKPHYTSEAMRAKIQGAVLLQGTVGTDGTVRDIRVVRSLDPSGLDVETIKAFSQWRFQPGMRDGQVVPVVVTMKMDFTLR
jgi:protein TonB